MAVSVQEATDTVLRALSRGSNSIGTIRWAVRGLTFKERKPALTLYQIDRALKLLVAQGLLTEPFRSPRTNRRWYSTTALWAEQNPIKPAAPVPLENQAKEQYGRWT